MNAPEVISDRYWIGGSNIAGILGISPFKTPLQEYLSITGQAPAIDEDQRRFFERRKKVEPYVISILEDEQQVKILLRNQRYTHPAYDFIRAEIDAETAEENIEIKSVHMRAADPWGDAGDDTGVPTYVVAQAMYGMMTNAKKRALVLAQIGFDDQRIYTVHRDEDTCALLRGMAVNFWENNVLKRVPPAPVSPADAARMWPKSRWREVVATDDVRISLRQMRELDVTVKSLEQQRDAFKLQAQKFMNDADILIDEGKNTLAVWRSSKESRQVDHEAYAAALEAKLEPLLMLPGEIQEMRQRFTKAVPGNRPFYNRIKV